MAELRDYGIGIAASPAPDRFVTRFGEELTDLAGPDRAALGRLLAEVGRAVGGGSAPLSLEQSMRGRAFGGGSAPVPGWTRSALYLLGARPDEVDAGAFARAGLEVVSGIDHYTHKIAATTGALVDALHRSAVDAGARVKLAARVAGFAAAGGGTEVRTEDGRAYVGAAVVLALPLNVWGSVDIDLPMPAEFAELAATGHAGRSAKVWLHVRGVTGFPRAVDTRGPLAYLRVSRWSMSSTRCAMATSVHCSTRSGSRHPAP
jgi:hypothetical protein